MRGTLAAHGLDSEIVDSYKYAATIFSRVVSDGYIGMVKTIPQLYGVIYDRAERVREANGFRVWASEFTARNIHGYMTRMRPSAVVCTHAFACGVMAAYKRLYNPSVRVVGVVTDYVVHPFWIYKNIDAYAVGTREMRAEMISRGIAPERIADDGIPIDPRFGDRPAPAELRRRLGLPADGPIVLVMGGGLGLGPVAAASGALAAIGRDLTTVVIAGKNPALERKMADAVKRSEADTRVFGYVDNVAEWMHAADVLVTKPGGLSTSEALAAELPMILVKPLPGQEERNARYLVEHGAALRADGRDDVVRLVRAFLDDPLTRETLRSAMRTLRRPRAAETIGTRIAELARGEG